MSPDKPGEDAGVSGFEPEETEPDSELEELELEVQQMAQRILHYRSTLSAQIKSSFCSLLESSRPLAIASEPGISARPDHEDDEQTTRGEDTNLHEEGLETAKKIQLIKDKISSNNTMIPTVLKRMKDCISTIDKLDSYNGVIHPAFKRKKTS
ncbi:uncharacterized protein LOC101223085 [Cucumis sativus]|uniref:Uncharacterized protein n=1 Tax=Cucumis sativus TaxID=3659 RepID=A0A0A0L8X5_CUCSA|nr:uncharacterized protein LOC101223085 [Cucumis sativus]KGN56521.1 hypothetical protein Csa_010054 [Cucumis sativus]